MRLLIKKSWSLFTVAVVTTMKSQLALGSPNIKELKVSNHVNKACFGLLKYSYFISFTSQFSDSLNNEIRIIYTD